MTILNIYIQGDSSYLLYPIVDYVKNTQENDVSLFFIKRKYPNPPTNKNVMVFDFPEAITAEWINAIANFATKINATAIRLHSAISYSAAINFPLLKAFQSRIHAGLTFSLFLYETSFEDVICRQEFNKLLAEGLDWQRYATRLKNKLTTESDDWNIVYNYLLNNLVSTQYFCCDFYKNKNNRFFSAPHFHYLSEILDNHDEDKVNVALSIQGADMGIINTIREINDTQKTLFFVDDGLEHPLGPAAKDACLLDDIQQAGYEFVFLMNYRGTLASSGSHHANIICLPETITLEVLRYAGIAAANVYGFCSLNLFSSQQENIKKIYFHEHENTPENSQLIKYVNVDNANKMAFSFINEAQQRAACSSVTKHIFLLAESMGDVLFAAGALNALRDKLSGSFICIVPKAYHPLLSLCPWVDELWDQHSLSAAQSEDIYMARVLGHFHLPSHVQHILDKRHQIDSFLLSLGHKEVSNYRKEIVLSLDNLDKTKVDNFLQQNGLTNKIVLIHPNVGVPNRTWPQASWAELVEKFIADGWSVVLIGSNSNFYSHKKAVEIENSRVFNAIDKFTMAETVYLMTQASLLVACDSGPVALAAATNIAICALYSVVPGTYRLPYRHGIQGWNALAIDRSCKYKHCASSYTLQSGETFDAWCPNNKRYSCMNGYAADDFYREVTQFLASENFIERHAGS